MIVCTSHCYSPSLFQPPLPPLPFETYLAGELSTYSMRTLHLYMKHMQKQKEDGINMNRRILEKEVELYGYPSLEAAEKRHR